MWTLENTIALAMPRHKAKKPWLSAGSPNAWGLQVELGPSRLTYLQEMLTASQNLLCFASRFSVAFGDRSGS